MNPVKSRSGSSVTAVPEPRKLAASLEYNYHSRQVFGYETAIYGPDSTGGHLAVAVPMILKRPYGDELGLQSMLLFLVAQSL
jgi:hypothetical protein